MRSWKRNWSGFAKNSGRVCEAQCNTPRASDDFVFQTHNGQRKDLHLNIIFSKQPNLSSLVRRIFIHK